MFEATKKCDIFLTFKKLDQVSNPSSYPVHDLFLWQRKKKQSGNK